MSVETLEKKTVDGRGLDTQEIEKIFSKYLQVVRKRNGTYILLRKKDQILLNACYFKNCGPNHYVVKGNCIKNKIYTNTPEEIERKILDKMKELYPESTGIKGKLKGYKRTKITHSTITNV